jgi:FkbM family methyltransferase
VARRRNRERLGLLRELVRRTFNKLRARLAGKSRNRDPYLVQRRLVTGDTPVIFDVGANVGQTAMRYRSLFPGATLHCVEPFGPSFEQLAKAFERDPQVVLHRFALAAASGSARLNVNSSAATNSLLESDARASHYWGDGLLDTQSTIEVETRTLDELCAELGVGHVDVLKIDVQGAEYAVLEGAKRLLSEQRVDLIYMEVIMAPTYVGQSELQDYLVLLASCGYRLFDFYNPARRDDRLIQADVIFVSRSFLEAYERSRPSDRSN